MTTLFAKEDSPKLKSLNTSLAMEVAVQAAAEASDSNKAEEFVLYFVRHFEKQAPTSNSKDVPLTEAGSMRSHQLAVHMSDVELERVFSTNYRRTLQTAAPISKRLDIAVEQYNPRRLTEFAKRLLSEQQTTLVVGHSNTTNVLYHAVGCELVKINESDYGTVFRASFEGTNVTCSSLHVPLKE